MRFKECADQLLLVGDVVVCGEVFEEGRARLSSRRSCWSRSSRIAVSAASAAMRMMVCSRSAKMSRAAGRMVQAKNVASTVERG